MSKQLLIKSDDIIKFTNVNALVDTDKFLQYVEIAQDIHIENFVGTKLLERLQSDLTNTTLQEPYTSLLEKYIRPMLIHWAMVEYLPYAPFSIANKGVFKHSSENAETVDLETLRTMIAKQRDTAMAYTDKFQKYMCANGGLFSEYNTEIDGQTKPDKTTNYLGWVI